MQRRWPSVEKAERLLGWRARIGVREGIEATAKWLQRRASASTTRSCWASVIVANSGSVTAWAA